MLVLSRRPGETIHIGSEITITIVEITGNRIRLGIQAPTNIPVWRGELKSTVTQPCAAAHLTK